ncbi:hypothetical protein D3C71_1522850 [compost metagenome]
MVNQKNNGLSQRLYCVATIDEGPHIRRPVLVGTTKAASHGINHNEPHGLTGSLLHLINGSIQAGYLGAISHEYRHINAVEVGHILTVVVLVAPSSDAP